MEGVESFHGHVKVLYERARALTSTCPVLLTLFDSEATRLRQEDEASCLETLCSSIRRQLAWASNSERGVRSVHGEADLMSSLVGLAVDRIIETVSTDKQWSAFAGRLRKRPTSEERPFGLVLVYVGSKGLPDDAGVVCISREARESDRDESEVIEAILERGYLLISEEIFSVLIDRLVADVREGRLRLPISREEVSKLTASGEPDPEAE